MAKSTKKIQVTLVRSLSGRLKKHQATVESLGLKKMHQKIHVDDIPSVRGKLNQVAYMLNVEEI